MFNVDILKSRSLLRDLPHSNIIIFYIFALYYHTSTAMNRMTHIHINSIL